MNAATAEAVSHAAIVRHHADFLREMAAAYRARSTEGPQHWRDYEVAEAEKLDARAAFYAAWAEREEEREMEEAIEHAA